MAHGSHRGARFRAAAALPVLVAVLAILVGPTAALALPGATGAQTFVEPDPELTPTEEPTPPPTEEPPPPPPPPPPTTPIFVPIEGVRVTASDVELSNAYWTGSGNTGTVQITVANTGNVAGQFNGQIVLPGKVQRTGISGDDGCAAGGGTTFTCSLGAGDPPGRVRLQVAVDADAWRNAPLTGSATVTVGGASHRSPFSILFPPGPPTPGISLAADNITLAPLTTPRPDTGQLTVRLSNTGAVPATGALEIITPPGVDLVTYPPNCVSRKRITTDRDRCDLGRVDAGKEVTATFGLSITAAARADAPLSGAIHGYLTPSGQDTSAVLATYRILTGAAPGESAAASGDASPGASGEPGVGAGASGDPLRAGNRTLLSSRISVLPIVGAIVGLVALAGLFVVLSLRRRLQDDVPPAKETGADKGDKPTEAGPLAGKEVKAGGG